MRRIPEIQPGHENLRGVLRVVGPAVAGMGLILIAIGLISFFSTFASITTGQFAFPRYFWCAFLGMPVLFVGLVLCQMAYVGSVARYFSAEVAPVQKDTFNYLAEGTGPGLRTIAQAVGEGFAAGAGGAARAVTCPRCQASNPPDADFCSGCGAPLGGKPCPRCGQENEPAAKFCNQCGAQVG